MPAKIEGHPAYEIHVHPESRHWFTHVERAGNSYVAELGYYSALGKWTRVSVSSGTMTPPDAVSPRTTPNSPRFRLNFRSRRLMEIIKAAVCENLRSRRPSRNCAAHGHPDLPRVTAVRSGHRRCPRHRGRRSRNRRWPKSSTLTQIRRVWMGSLEITELIRRKLAHEISSLGVSSSFGVSSLSSPFGGMERAKGFWFNVNAELIIYGATEPDAKVTLGGHEIKLRSDGTFSYRFCAAGRKIRPARRGRFRGRRRRARGGFEIQPRRRNISAMSARIRRTRRSSRRCRKACDFSWTRPNAEP